MASSVEELGLKVDSSGVVKGTSDLDNLSAAAGRAERSAQEFGDAASAAFKIDPTPMQNAINAMVGISEATNSAQRSAQAFGDAANSERARFEALRASVDPLFAASKKYETVLRELDVAQKLGVASGKELAATQNAAEQSLLSVGKATATTRDSMEQLRSSIDPLYAASKNYESAITQIDAALKDDVITQSEHNAMMDAAASKYLAIGSSMRTQTEAASALRASVDPLYSSSKKYEATLTELNGLLEANAISEKEYAAINEAAAQKFLSVDEAALHVNETMKLSGQSIMNVRIQMLEMMHITREFGAMVAMGVNPGQAALMELGRAMTLVEYSSGGIGNALRLMAQGVMRAATAFIGFATGPLGLTLAGVTALAGGIAYLDGAFDKTSLSLKEWEKATADITKQQTALNGAMSDALQPLSALEKKYGDAATAVQKLLLEQAKEQLELTKESIATAKKNIETQYGGLLSTTKTIDTLTKSPALSGPLRPDVIAAIHDQLQTLQVDFHMNYLQASQFAKAYSDFTSNKDANAQIEDITTMKEILAQTRDTTGQIPAKVKAIEENLTKAGIQLGSFKDASQTVKLIEEAIGKTDLSTNIKNGTAAAIEMAKSLGISLNLAMKLVAIQHKTPAQNRITAGIESGAIPNVSSARVAAGDMPKDTTFSYTRGLNLIGHPNPTKTHTATHHHKTPMVMPDGTFTAQKAYDQVIKDTTSHLKNYQLMLEQIPIALKKGAISTLQASQETSMLKQKILEASDAGKYMSGITQSFENTLDNGIPKIRSLTDAFNLLRTALANVAAQLASGLFQSALFGTGPFSNGGTIASPSSSLFGGFLSGLTSKGASILPGLASGTDFAYGGPTLVGEHGPEIVNMPRGSHVSDAHTTRKILGGRGGGQPSAPPQVHIKQINVLDPSIVADYLATADGEQLIMNVVSKNS